MIVWVKSLRSWTNEVMLREMFLLNSRKLKRPKNLHLPLSTGKNHMPWQRVVTKLCVLKCPCKVPVFCLSLFYVDDYPCLDILGTLGSNFHLYSAKSSTNLWKTLYLFYRSVLVYLNLQIEMWLVLYLTATGTLIAVERVIFSMLSLKPILNNIFKIHDTPVSKKLNS